MTDDIFTTDQDILSNVLLRDDDAADFADDDLTTGGLDPLELDEEEEDPDSTLEESYDDVDEF